MRKSIEWIITVILAMAIVLCVKHWPWTSLVVIVSLATGFAFGNMFRARIEMQKRGRLQVKVTRLENFKRSAEALCGRIKTVLDDPE